MKILIEVKSVEVFLGSDNNAIAKYVIKETKAQGEYEDEFEKYVNIELKDGKVSNIKALSNEERSEEHTSELQSRFDLVCRLLLEKKKDHGEEGDEETNGRRVQ